MTLQTDSAVRPAQARRIHELLDFWQTRAGDAPFLIEPGGTLSMRSLGRMVDAIEGELRAAGVGPGDRVLIVAENCAAHVALILGCSRVGACSCGVNARMAPGEVDAFAEKADARLIYFTSGVSEAAAKHGARHQAQASVLEGLTRSAVRVDAQPEQGADDVAALIFTSGTSGTPKGVMVTHAALLHFARISAASRELGPADRAYAFLPMTHIFGLGTMLLATLYAGGALLLRRQLDIDDLLHALAHEGITTLQGPPTLFARLLAHLRRSAEKPVAPKLRYLYTGSAPLDLSLKREVEAIFGQTLHHGYGLSEYAGSLFLTRAGERRDDSAAGYCVEGAEARIVDAEGSELGTDETGELWIRGVGLTPGYFRDPQATAQAMRPGGWYATGDLARRGADGALFIVGRLKEMIIRSGFNVYPAEVEAALNAFPAVQQSAVVGEREADGNERIVAFLELRGSAVLDEDALREHLRARLSPYKMPARFVVVPALPTTSNGKLLKRELLARL